MQDVPGLARQLMIDADAMRQSGLPKFADRLELAARLLTEFWKKDTQRKSP